MKMKDELFHASLPYSTALLLLLLSLLLRLLFILSVYLYNILPVKPGR